MKRTIAVMALVVFLVIDAVLLVVLFQQMGDARVSQNGDQPVSASTPTASDTPDPEAAGPAALEQIDDGLLARISRGRCTGQSAPLLEVSADQGATFNEVALPLLDDTENLAIRSVLQVRASSATDLTLVGSNQQCEERQFSTDDGGASWTESDSLSPPSTARGWYVDASGTGVVSPTGGSDLGCDVVALGAVSDRNAKVACADGTIRGTDSNGDEWVLLGTLDGVSAMTFTALSDGYAIAPSDDCEAAAFVTASTGLEWESVGCVADQGSVQGLVGTEGRLSALIDGDVLVSTDQGQTWDSPGA
ncbi:hypothetical protein [Aeromicrobium sp. CF3.5]|uniref:hypothetical protein n=1 Tax=Aeromicrobium sp. CF3.5 TaxID=3373078 RepID=UPI003EE6335E